MSKNIITGIDVGSLTIRVAVVEKIDDGLNILTTHEQQSDGMKHGYVINREEAVKSIEKVIKTVEKTIGLPIKRAVISIGGISLGSVKSKGMIMISKADGEISDYDVKRVINQSEASISNILNKQIIRTIPIQFKVDSNLVMGKPIGLKGNKLEVETFSITCLGQHLNDFIKTIESSNIAIEDIIASPLARSYSVLTKKQKDAGCVLADIGSSTVSVIVFENGLPISLETFPIGSSHITNDIALGFQISLSEAEKLKFDFGKEVPVSKKKLSDIIEARLNDIFELIESHLKKINRDGMLPGGIILTGGGSELFSLDEIAKACLRLPAKIGTIKENNYININAPTNLKEKIFDDPSWSTVLGLCIMSASENESDYSSNNQFWVKTTDAIKRLFHSLIP